MTLDMDELANIISENAGSPDTPGWAGRIAEAIATEGLKTAIKEAVVQVGKSIIS